MCSRVRYDCFLKCDMLCMLVVCVDGVMYDGIMCNDDGLGCEWRGVWLCGCEW